MLSIAELHPVLHELFHDTADQLARETGFCQRVRQLTGATFAQSLVFSLLENPAATLDDFADSAEALGIDVTPQAFDRRFNAPAREFLRDLFLESFNRSFNSLRPALLPVLRRFPAVFLRDATLVSLPASLAAVFPGRGGRHVPHGQAAAVKLVLEAEVTTGALTEVSLLPGLGNEKASDVAGKPLPKGSLLLEDMGFFCGQRLQDYVDQGVYVLTRIPAWTAVFDLNGRRLDLVRELRQCRTDYLERPIRLLHGRKVPLRLRAVRLPEAEAEQRRQRVRQEAKQRGRPVSQKKLDLCAWNILVTNAPKKLLGLQEAGVVRALADRVSLQGVQERGADRPDAQPVPLPGAVRVVRQAAGPGGATLGAAGGGLPDAAAQRPPRLPPRAAAGAGAATGHQVSGGASAAGAPAGQVAAPPLPDQAPQDQPLDPGPLDRPRPRLRPAEKKGRLTLSWRACGDRRTPKRQHPEGSGKRRAWLPRAVPWYTAQKKWKGLAVAEGIMARSVICHNCGHRIEVDEGYTRRKVRCPECGVACDVPDAPKPDPAEPRPSKPSAAPAPPQKAEELARQLCSEPDKKPPPKKREPPPPPPREEKPAPVPRRPVEVVEGPLPPPGPPKRAAQTWTEEDEDGSPYEIVGGPERKCPQCFHVLEPEAVLCVRCGLDLKSGKKVVREFKPLARSWEPVAYEKRLTLFGAAVAVGLVLSVLTGVLLDQLAFGLGPWVLFVILMAFLLGTFDRIDLVRDKRGRTTLTRTWRVCFIPRPTIEIDLLQYDAVVTGISADAGCYEWFILWTLVPFGLVPAGIWWYQVIHKKKYHAALAHSHNYPEVTLYRGSNREQAEDIAETLRDAARLRYERE
jgi:hypothetical protein